MAGEQRRLAHAPKRDSTSMKILSLLGAIFLPATYLASIFSMAFFDFIPDDGSAPASSLSPSAATTVTPSPNPSGGAAAAASAAAAAPWSPVSPLLWIYFAITVPITLAIVLCWRWWDKRREVKFAKEDEDIEKGIERMEAEIMATMRKRTLSKMRTWEVGKA
jgi:hypothetical protein